MMSAGVKCVWHGNPVIRLEVFKVGFEVDTFSRLDMYVIYQHEGLSVARE